LCLVLTIDLSRRSRSGALSDQRRDRASALERQRSAQILEESLAPGAVVSAVARRHGLTPQQLFTWRREVRKRAEAETLAFVPAVVAPEPAGLKRQARPRRRPAAIELETAGVMVRICDGASPATIAAVIGALRGST
jgi:transposase